MREKCFPTGTFLHAQMGHSPSYAWSIIQARAVLERGLVWRVWNGEQIKIWGDKWLFSPSTYHVQSPVRGLDPEARVSSLIDPDIRWWNFPLIRVSFNMDEADRICRVWFLAL